MRLVIGGYGQGKLEYVLSGYQVSEEMVREGVPEKYESCGKSIPLGESSLVVNHLHLWVRERLLQGGCPEEELSAFLDRCGNCIVICDEVGNGIVPADAFEREYRERVGRISIMLARRAEGVERVLCGIGQKLK